MLRSRESRTVAEIFVALADMARGLLEAHEDVPREAAGFERHEDDHARGSMAAEDLLTLVQVEHEAIAACVDDASLTPEKVARVRHDLRAQIQAVKGYAEMVLEEMHERDDVSLHLRASFARIVDAAGRALPQIDRLQYAALSPLDFYETSYERRSHALVESTYDPEVGYESRYRGCRVLLIDDSEPNRDVLSRRLRRVGLDVRVAATGEEGIALLLEQPAHVVLCDVIMPGMDGYEVLRRMKNDERLRDIPVLMISALREDETIVRCIEAGADDYLPTPLRSTILHARIKACLNRKLLLDKEREQNEALAQAREELISAIESMSDGFAIWGNDERIHIYNEAFRYTYPFVATLPTSFSFEQFARACIDANVPVESEEGRFRCLRDAIARHRSPDPHVLRLRDGRSIEITNHRTPHDAIVSVHKDVTSRKKDEDHLRYLAMHDPLTGLANRTTFDARLAQAVCDQDQFALLFLDLDRFKDVNDTLGHDAGDRLLIHVAEAIRAVVRTGDLVARVGGDEFAILLLEPLELNVVSHVASRVLQGIGTTYTEGSRVVTYGATIGIAMHPDHSGSPASAEMLLQHADIAMYAAKRQGRGRHAFYAPRLSSPP